MIINKTLLKIGINTLFQSTGKLISLGLGFISVVLLTRYLGPSNYGVFSLVFAYLSFFVLFSDLGLQTTIINHLAQNKEKKEEIFATFFWLKLALSILSNILAVLILVFFHYSQIINISIIIGALALIISDVTGYSTAILQSEIKLGVVTVIDVLTKLVTVASLVLFVIAKLNLFYIIASVGVGNIAGLIFGFYIVKDIAPFNFNFDLKEAKHLISRSIIIGVAAFFSTVYFKLDTVMLSVMKTPKDVGIYSLSYNIFENTQIFWAYYTTSFYPLLAMFNANHNQVKVRKLLSDSILVGLVYSAFIVIFGYILAPFIIDIFGGHLFMQSILPFRILILSSIFFFMTSIFYFYFYIKNQTKLILICIICSLLFNFTSNLLIIPRYSYIGTSYTTIATEAFLMVIYAVIFFSQRKNYL